MGMMRGCLTGLGSLLAFLFSGHLGCAGFVIGFLVLLFLAYVAYHAIPLVVFLLRGLLAIGLLFGAGITIRNYAQALYFNIKPEKVTP